MTRQDIVLSGHFIKDEHCIFTSSAGPMDEGEQCLLMHLNIQILVYIRYHRCTYKMINS